ncbi:hypothetical protein E1B28_011916 [Marasmius oreades]|uniref:Cytochrome P450 n=1 Tax=Marasmius oreades TaxID=181124 RepID=A0A9P7USM1_9AGAR|nr:uncharacterized protein E1B28_011916 [Marasmius oreades]KAG7090319.1 hypothetical protein E1B28_011916 [Marasmius oreades]
MFVLKRVDLAVTALSFFLFLSFYLVKRRSTLRILRGPSASSYLLGLEHYLRVENIVTVLFKWSKEYGTAYRFPGCFGQKILVISDPRAIHRVLQESVLDYPEAADIKRIFEMIFGRGVLWASGEDHKRHRRVLSPAFSINHMRQFLPLFQSHVNHLSEKWNQALQGKGRTIDIIPWFHKVTLDVIGESAFNYHFDAIDNKPNELTQTLYDLEKLGVDPVPGMTLVAAVPRYVPDAVAAWQAKNFPVNGEKIAKRYLELSNQKAREVMKEAGLDLNGDGETDDVPIGTGTEKDVLSVLVRANRAEDPRKRLSEGEMLAQMSTLIQAGHHTTGYTLSWILYELAAHPEDQAKVYEEIRHIRETNSEGLTSSDYDSMTHLTLVLKEALRLHPVVPTLEREAMKNDVLLLDFPVVSKDGKTVDAIPVRNGQRIKVDISSYNRLESVWGEDANSWNPKRFATDSEGKTQTQVGLFANILTFSGGPKGCIGWRFAVMEMQAIIAGLLERYEFSIPAYVEIEAGNPGLVVPNVKGKETEGAQLPLKVTPRASV